MILTKLKEKYFSSKILRVGKEFTSYECSHTGLLFDYQNLETPKEEFDRKVKQRLEKILEPEFSEWNSLGSEIDEKKSNYEGGVFIKDQTRIGSYLMGIYYG